VRTAAARLCVCEATVYKLCAKGTLLHYRVSNAIRIAPSDLEGRSAVVRRAFRCPEKEGQPTMNTEDGVDCGFRPSRSAIPADADHPFRQGDHSGRDGAE